MSCTAVFLVAVPRACSEGVGLPGWSQLFRDGSDVRASLSNALVAPTLHPEWGPQELGGGCVGSGRWAVGSGRRAVGGGQY